MKPVYESVLLLSRDLRPVPDALEVPEHPEVDAEEVLLPGRRRRTSRRIGVAAGAPF
jgi:hypothetical protein